MVYTIRIQCGSIEVKCALFFSLLHMHIPSSPRLIHRSGKNRCGSGKYSSEFDTAKCGKMTCVYVVRFVVGVVVVVFVR